MRMVSLFVLLMTSSVSFGAEIFNWGILDELVYFRSQAQLFKEEVESKTNGAVKINIVPYPERNEKNRITTDFIKNNKYQIVQELSGKLDHINTELQLWTLPFLFRDEVHTEKFIRILGQKTLKKLETDKLLPVDYTFSGGFVVVRGKKLESFEQLKGKTLSTEIGHQFYNSSLKQLGIKVNFSRELRQDYVENISAVADEIALHGEIVNTAINVTDHRVVSRVLFVDKAKLGRLSPEHQKIFMETLKKYATFERLESNRGRKIVFDLLKNRGAKFHVWGAKEKSEGKAMAAKLYSDFEQKHPGLVSEIEAL